MQHSLSEKEYFDYAFLGMGAANALIFIKFFEAGLLYNKRIIIIDLQSVETLNQDKTYCFWSDPEEINRLGLNDMYTASWHQVKINSKVTPLGKYAYYHIPSAALMSRFKEVLERQHYKYIEDRVSDVNKQSDMFRIQTQSNDEFEAHLVFDSRLPQWNSPKSHQAHLLQSFYGQVVTASVPVFDPKTFTMMDFSVPQMGFTQFLYVLPYSKHKALVELTRFGTSVITKEEGQQFLQSWMLEQESKLSLEKEEYGVIPMSTAEIVSSPLEGMGNYFRVGTAAGRVKPSTGYAFKRMCRDALHLVEIVQNKQRSVKDFPRKESERFAFYDRLLLKILETTPSMGKHIFTRLFERISPIKVFRFLEEKTTIIEEVPILMSLPKKPFLAAAFRDALARK